MFTVRHSSDWRQPRDRPGLALRLARDGGNSCSSRAILLRSPRLSRKSRPAVARHASAMIPRPRISCGSRGSRTPAYCGIDVNREQRGSNAPRRFLQLNGDGLMDGFALKFQRWLRLTRSSLTPPQTAIMVPCSHFYRRRRLHSWPGLHHRRIGHARACLATKALADLRSP